MKGVKLPKDLSFLEWSAVFYYDNKVQQNTIKGPFHYFEVHPFVVMGKTIDNAVLQFKENNGNHYATLSPIGEGEASEEIHKNIYAPDESFVLPGMFNLPFPISFMRRDKFSEFLERHKEATLSISGVYKNDRKISRDERISRWEDRFSHCADIKKIVEELFSHQELADYGLVKRNKLKSEDSDLPVFSLEYVTGKMKASYRGPFYEKVLSYFVGDTETIREKLSRSDYSLLFSLSMLGSTLAIGADMAYEKPVTGLMGIPGTLLMLDYFSRASVNIADKGNDIRFASGFVNLFKELKR
jgi:hypothetical protein